MPPGANPALIEVKLRALARVATGADLDLVDPGVGAGLSGDTAFYLVDDDPRAVGKAIQWASSRGARRVEILAATGGGDLARRAGLLVPAPGPDPGPEVRVWDVRGAVASPAPVAPLAPAPPLPAHHRALAGVISEAGARPVDDHGLLVAEVAGLEVARVVDVAAPFDPDAASSEADPSGASPSGPGTTGPQATIEVGVGQADRELSALVHTRDDIDTGLRRVVAAVVQHRSAHGDSHHPLTRLARERWLRSILLDHPELVDAAELQALVPLRPRRGLVRNEPSAAGGRLRSGRPVVVVTMVGVDLDLIPEAADYRLRFDPDAAVVLALSERDLALSTRLLPRLPDASAVALRSPWLT